MSEANKYLSDSNFNFTGKSVLVRIDCDVDLCVDETCDEKMVDAEFRLKAMLPTLKFLEESGVKKIIMIGHLGRPNGQPDDKLSLAPIANWYSDNYKDCSLIARSFSSDGVSKELLRGGTSSLSLLENLRFHPGERDNDPDFVQQLVNLADIYVDDAFATAHRKHASTVGVPQFLPAFLGLRMEKEIKNLTKIKKEAKRPLVIALGGSKKGKMDYVPSLAKMADTLLIGGKLPLQRNLVDGQYPNIKWAELKENKRDLSEADIEKFKNALHQAESIFMVGPLGVYEEEENRRGTAEIAQTIAEMPVFKLAAGGDTHRVLSWLDMWDKFDFVSTGGGSALQFLRDETLPGIEIIASKTEKQTR
jgi:phosphoglycerate kinase